MCLRIMILFLGWTNSIAQPAPQFTIGLDAQLHFADELASPLRQNSIHEHPAQATRSLGLTQLLANIDVKNLYQTRAHLGLRLDALNSTDTSRQRFDSRSGRIYFKRSELKPLDEYELALLFGPDLDVSIGVFPEFLKETVTYQNLLDFGLGVLPADHFSAIRVRWRQTATASPTADPQRSNNGMSVDLYVYQGRQDRGEKNVFRDSTADYGPGADDPHNGVALVYAHQLEDTNRFALLLGSSREAYKLSPEDRYPSDPKATGNGLRQDYFLGIFNKTSFNLLGGRGQIAVDYRLMKEKYNSEEYHLKSRLHQSIALSNRFQFNPIYAAYLGLFYGSNQLAEGLKNNGYQGDLGLIWSIKEAASIQIQVSEEHRSSSSSSGEAGAFAIDLQPTRVIRRIALAANYQLGSR